MAEQLTWQFVLPADPSKVFCSLVRAATQEGRVCAVEDFGTVLTYTPTKTSGLAGRMRATVRPCGEGALVSITPVEPRVDGWATRAVEARAVATLVDGLRQQYERPALDTAS